MQGGLIVPGSEELRTEQIKTALAESSQLDQDYYSAHRGLYGTLITLASAILAGAIAVLDKVQPLSSSSVDGVAYLGGGALLASIVGSTFAMWFGAKTQRAFTAYLIEHTQSYISSLAAGEAQECTKERHQKEAERAEQENRAKKSYDEARKHGKRRDVMFFVSAFSLISALAAFGAYVAL